MALEAQVQTNRGDNLTDTIKDKVLHILDLAVRFNDSETRQDITGKKPTIFVNFSGHICGLSVNICLEGYSPECNFFDQYLSLIAYLDEENAERELDGIIKTLELIIDQWNKTQK